jgi:hypothetical protein
VKAAHVNESWNGLAILHTAAARGASHGGLITPKPG